MNQVTISDGVSCFTKGIAPNPAPPLKAARRVTIPHALYVAADAASF
jgi:hypothetical protein